MTNTAWSFNTLPTTSQWFCQIRMWTTLRNKLLYQTSHTIALISKMELIYLNELCVGKFVV